MTTLVPLRYNGDGEFTAVQGHRKRCDMTFIIGETYVADVRERRSEATHRHYMASVTEIWENLPERLAEEYPTPDALRKRALIRAGFCDTRTLVASSHAEALRLAAFMRPMDTEVLIIVRARVVMSYTAHSQSYAAMEKTAFAKSKEAVLAILSDMIGVDRRQLEQAA